MPNACVLCTRVNSYNTYLRPVGVATPVELRLPVGVVAPERELVFFGFVSLSTSACRLEISVSNSCRAQTILETKTYVDKPRKQGPIFLGDQR